MIIYKPVVEATRTIIMPAAQPSAVSKQSARAAESTEAILNAAIELVAAEGAKASIHAIAKRAGFSHGLVMARFGSKAGLIQAVTKQVQKRFLQRVTRDHQMPGGLASLNAAIRSFLAQASTDSASRAFYVLLGEALGSDREIRSAFVAADRAFRTYLERMIVEAQANGEIDAAVRPAVLAALIVGMLRGLALQLRVNSDAFDREAVCVQAIQLVGGLARQDAG